MPKTLPLVTIPTPSLRVRSVEVDPAVIGTPDFQLFLDDLIQTMFDDNGVGIASPQVGRNDRIFVVDEKSGPRVIINPEVTATTKSLVESEEGCLSVPGVYGIVERFKKVHVTGLDRHGRKMAFDARGFMAIVYQHEYDHLNGVLFIDKAIRMTKGGNSVRV